MRLHSSIERQALVSGKRPRYYAGLIGQGGLMRNSLFAGRSRRGITVLGLALLIIAIVIAAALLVRYY
jgi:hypothetical protein